MPVIGETRQPTPGAWPTGSAGRLASAAPRELGAVAASGRHRLRPAARRRRSASARASEPSRARISPRCSAVACHGHPGLGLRRIAGAWRPPNPAAGCARLGMSSSASAWPGRDASPGLRPAGATRARLAERAQHGDMARVEGDRARHVHRLGDRFPLRPWPASDAGFLLLDAHLPRRRRVFWRLVLGVGRRRGSGRRPA